MGEKTDIVRTYFIKDIVENSKDSELIKKFCSEQIEENRIYSIQAKAKIQDIISSTNNDLSSSKQRQHGLWTLGLLVQQCSTEVFQEYAMVWLKLLVQILDSRDTTDTMDQAYAAFGQIISHLGSFPDICRDFSTQLLPLLLQKIVAQKVVSQHSLQCLKECLKTVTKSCTPAKVKLEAFLVGLIHDPSLYYTEVVCECLGLLGGCGTGKQAEGWGETYLRIIGQLHGELDILYHSAQTADDTTDRPEERFTLSTVSDVAPVEEEPLKTITSVQRFKAWSRALATFVRTKTKTTVKVNLPAAIGLLQRVFSVTTKFLLSRPTRDHVLLLFALSDVYTSALDILEAMLESFRSSLLPYTLLVSSWLSQLLRSTQPERTDFIVQQPNRQIRVTVYKALSCLLCSLGACSGVEDYCEVIIQQVAADCSPVSDSQVATKSKTDLSEVSEHFRVGKKGKKGKGWGGSPNIGLISFQRKTQADAGRDVCRAALTALSHLLVHFGPLVPHVLHPSVRSFLTTLTPLLTSSAVPYDHVACRVQGYQVLQSAALVPCLVPIPLLRVFVTAFSQGIKDQDSQISCLCASALCVMQCVLHPRTPSLTIPSHAPPENAANSSTDRERLLGNFNYIASKNAPVHDSSLSHERTDDSSRGNKRRRVGSADGEEMDVSEERYTADRENNNAENSGEVDGMERSEVGSYELVVNNTESAGDLSVLGTEGGSTRGLEDGTQGLEDGKRCGTQWLEGGKGRDDTWMVDDSDVKGARMDSQYSGAQSSVASHDAAQEKSIVDEEQDSVPICKLIKVYDIRSSSSEDTEETLAMLATFVDAEPDS